MYFPLISKKVSDWPISIHNWVYIFHRVLSDPNSDVLYSEVCQVKKLNVCFFQSHF